MINKIFNRMIFYYLNNIVYQIYFHHLIYLLKYFIWNFFFFLIFNFILNRLKKKILKMIKNVVNFFKNIFYKQKELFILNLLFKLLIILGQKNKLIRWKGHFQILFIKLNSHFHFYRSHQLTLKNELILSMINKNSEWERVLTENIIQLDDQVWD